MQHRMVLFVFLIAASVFVFQDPARASDNHSPLSFDTSLFVENDVEIKARLSGIIDQILVDRGAEVRKGTPLAKLENKDLYLEMQRAKAIMLEAESAFQRAKSLYDQQLLSASEYDQKRLAFDRAKAESDLSEVNYEKSIIVAPFNGVVVDRYVHLGQRVVEDDNVSLFRIAAMSPLLARIFVTEEQLDRLSIGTKADFVPALGPTHKIPARVKWISSVIDPASGLAPVILEIRIGQAQQPLKPGTSGKVIILVE